MFYFNKMFTLHKTFPGIHSLLILAHSKNSRVFYSPPPPSKLGFDPHPLGCAFKNVYCQIQGSQRLSSNLTSPQHPHPPSNSPNTWQKPPWFPPISAAPSQPPYCRLSPCSPLPELPLLRAHPSFQGFWRNSTWMLITSSSTFRFQIPESAVPPQEAFPVHHAPQITLL